MRKLIIIAVGLVCLSSMAYGYEGRRADSVLLNGVWEFAEGDGGEDAERPEGQAKLNWQQTNLPGRFTKWGQGAATTIKYIWAKRTFEISKAQAKKLAVLRWNRIRFGATAFINGQKAGENEPTGPYQVIVPEGVLRAGINEIVLKIPGAVGVRKGASGYFLIPAGFASCHKRGIPAVTDDIWIDFAERVYIKWALAIPDMAGSKVRIRVTPAGVERIDELKVTAAVRTWPDGNVTGSGETSARLIPWADPLGGEHFFVEVPMPNYKAWTYEEPNLYTAEVTISKGGKALDAVSFRFGMREVKVVDENYKLNGKNLWLRGSNLVFEWEWGNIITGKEKDYLVTEAREMSMNCFRTHTQPMPRLWADICDEYGTMVLSEFPALYNYRNYNFTPEEYEVWHKNVLTDAAGWMGRLWNHPSIVMWVLTNESVNDTEWEQGPYRDFVLKLDPSRPTMRTGRDGGTKENLDFHMCSNTIWTNEAKLIADIPNWFEPAKGRTLTNTEYMNIYKRPVCQWTGTDDKEADLLAYAQLGAEHTEAMRRERLDCLLPYMYAGWTKTRRGEEWKAGYAQPVSACWHSTLSGVLASLDLFNPNYLVGQEVTTKLYLINDTWDDAEIHVDLLLTKECPEFIPEAECFDKPISRWSYDFKLKADTLTKTPVTWKLPNEKGSYWLTARTTGIEGRAVLSQRFVRAVKPPQVPPAVMKRTFIVLGGDNISANYFKSKGLKTGGNLDELEPDENMVIIWNAAELTAEEKQKAKSLCDFAAGGGRVVVLSTKLWDWGELCDVAIDKPQLFSRVFAYEGTTHPMLSGIERECLMRWNGVNKATARTQIKGPAMEKAKKILWGRDPNSTVAAEVPDAKGEGKILFCQLDIQSHIDKNKDSYDPVAEQILLNLLCSEIKNAHAKASLAEIYAPVRVGTPPENAFNGLLKLVDGELRHYGHEGKWNGPASSYYIESGDNVLTWKRGGSYSLNEKSAGQDKQEKSFLAIRGRRREGTAIGRNPVSGNYIGISSGRDGTYLLRGCEGLDGPFEMRKIMDERFGMVRQPIFLRSRNRALISTARSIVGDNGRSVIESCVLYSDDDGHSWELVPVGVGPRHEAVWPHKAIRWQNYAVEPTVAELADGNLWLLARTSMDNLYESFSEDGGVTWSELAPSRFYCTLTMPTFFRLSDGRLMLFWCNTTPLPEVDRTNDASIREDIREEVLKGTWEDVFTNRDAIHAAISEDEGKTWIGFRELYLNPLRNEPDFAVRRGTGESLDRSVHQSQAVELPDGKVLVALGQHPLVRSFVIFDPDWLYETKWRDDFSKGLGDWCTFKFLRGIRGHCAYNREAGARLINHPNKQGAKALHIGRRENAEVICENDGAVWNFPAGRKGKFVINIMLNAGGQGGRICLMDRWVNPTDLLAGHYAMYSFSFDGDGKSNGKKFLEVGRRHELRFEWNDLQAGDCRLYIDGKRAMLLPLNRPSVNGISYAHLQSAATETDSAGFLVESVEAEVGL